MAMTSSVRIDDDVSMSMSAMFVGEVESRSVSQQLADRAFIGRELEASPHVPTLDVEQVLAGRRDYGSLTPLEQATVRAEWAGQIHQRLE